MSTTKVLCISSVTHVVLFLLLAFNSFSQHKYNNGSYWASYSGDHKINDKIGIHTDGQFRNLGVYNAPATGLIRVGANFYTSKTSRLTAGYAFVYKSPTNEEMGGNTSRENRIWEQFLMRKKTNFLFMEHRYRLEHRFTENLTHASSSTVHRLRYRFQLIFPLYSISPRLRYFFLAANDEIMVNLTPVTSEIYDRNRMYFALGIQVSPKLNFQFGYMNQLANQTFIPEVEQSHAFQLRVSYNMDDLMRSFFVPVKK